MSAKVDYTALKQFRDNLEKLSKTQMQQFTEAAVKDLAARLLRKVKMRTPVGVYPKVKVSGKKGGTLRRGWRVGAVVKDGSAYTVEIINPTPYASYVEFGHRTRDHTGWVEGRFMMTISEQELQRDAPGILERKLNQFLKGAFGA